jgi:hypothetical protein
MNQEAVPIWVVAGRVIWQLREVLLPLRGGQGVTGGGANPLDGVIDVEVPQLGCAVVAARGQGVPVRAERHRVNSVRGAGQRLAELGGVGRVGEVPQPDFVIVAAGGQDGTCQVK